MDTRKYAEEEITFAWDTCACDPRRDKECKQRRREYKAKLKSDDTLPSWLGELCKRACFGGKTARTDAYYLKQGLFHWEIHGLGSPSAITIYNQIEDELDRRFSH